MYILPPVLTFVLPGSLSIAIGLEIKKKKMVGFGQTPHIGVLPV